MLPVLNACKDNGLAVNTRKTKSIEVGRNRDVTVDSNSTPLEEFEN